MQLVLVDTSDVFSNLSKDGLVLKVWTNKVALKRKRDHDYDSDEANLLTSEMLDKVSCIGVVLKLKLEKKMMEFYLAANKDDCTNGRNVYEKLWNRFQNVQISVEIKRSTRKGEALKEFAKMEGLTIDSQQFFCRNRIPSNKTKLEQYPVMHLKIAAHVPDSVFFDEEIPFAQKILKEQKFTDVIIRTANGGEIKAHKVFLSACSPVLDAMFHDMKESKTCILDMTDVSYLAVKRFLQFVYYNDPKIVEEHVEVILQMLCIASKYRIRSLQAKMTTCLMERRNEDFSASFALKLYLFSRSKEPFVELKRKCVEVLKRKLDELEALPEYKELFTSCNSHVAMELCREFAKPSLSNTSPENQN